MRSQIRPISERPVTISTRKRLLSCMGSNVTLQQPRPRKSFPANGTLARQSMGPDVHFQSSQRYVHFLTIFTAKGFLRTIPGGAMELPVFRQSGKSRITFPTIRTLMSDPCSPFLRQIFSRRHRLWRWGSSRTIRTQTVLIQGGINCRSEC